MPGLSTEKYYSNLYFPDPKLLIIESHERIAEKGRRFTRLYLVVYHRLTDLRHMEERALYENWY
jgi:hypothetical protein